MRGPVLLPFWLGLGEALGWAVGLLMARRKVEKRLRMAWGRVRSQSSWNREDVAYVSAAETGAKMSRITALACKTK